MPGLIEFNCSNCGTTIRAPEASAGKAGKCKSCKASITVPPLSFIQSKDDVKVVTPTIIQRPSIAQEKSSLLRTLASAVFRRESDEVKKARIAAKMLADLERRRGWTRFWFQVRMGILTMFLALVGLIGFLAYIGRNAPHTTYVSTSYSAPPASASPAKSSQIPVASHTHATSNGNFKEGAVEKIYEKVTGKEIVHKKDGTTYERKQPKR